MAHDVDMFNTKPKLEVEAMAKPQVSAELVERLQKRAEIRRQIPDRKSVKAGEPDRIADLLEEAAAALLATQAKLEEAEAENKELWSCIAQVSPHIPKADITCDEPGITFLQAVEKTVRAAMKGSKA